MIWTKEKPTEAGWYWVVWSSVPQVVYVVDFGGRLEMLVVNRTGFDNMDAVKWWLGPFTCIAPPEAL